MAAAALRRADLEGRTDPAAGARIRAELFERILARIHRYFSRMVRDPVEAEECVQRTLVELERSLREGTYDPERSFNAWMWLKARTAWAAWCRERERRPRSLPDDFGLAASGGAAGAQEGREVASVERRLDAETVLAEVKRRLGDEAHEAFVLYYEGELTLAEVAETLGRDRKTVSRRISDAHALIDRLLGRSGGPDAQ
jgi:RNA polymerase sigma factor (sigma-70 family)